MKLACKESKDSLFFIGYPQCLTGDDEMNVHWMNCSDLLLLCCWQKISPLT